MARDQFPIRARSFSLLHRVQTGFDVHPGSCSAGAEGHDLRDFSRLLETFVSPVNVCRVSRERSAKPEVNRALLLHDFNQNWNVSATS
jgi:hypothetical protein